MTLSARAGADTVDVADLRRLARRAKYEEQLRSMPRRGPIYVTYGGDALNALKTLLSDDPGRGEHYVYLHRGPNDEVFYVGKGRGNRAYSKDREDLWHHYLRTRCKGEYEVEIVRYFETDEDALSFESDLIALFGERTVNVINTARKTDFEVLARFHKLRKANWAKIAVAIDLLPIKPDEAEIDLRRAIADMADYARLTWEEGLHAELVNEVYPHYSCHLNAQDLSALSRLTLLLKSQSRWDDLTVVVDDFFLTYPETRQQGVAKQIIKRGEAARAKRPA